MKVSAMDEVWSVEEIALYEEWQEAWNHPDFDWDLDLDSTGEEILSKAERIGPPPSLDEYLESQFNVEW